MAFQMSPGVEIREFDLTQVIPTIATTPAGFVGVFQWGPVDKRVLVQTEKQLTSYFGKPLASTGYEIDWFLVSNFLSYGGQLNVVRTYLDDKNANSKGLTSILIKNRENYEIQKTINADVWGVEIAAKYPGNLGNSLQVVMIDSADPYPNPTDGTGLWDTYIDAYGLPTTSSYASQINPNANDEFHILVIDAGGKISGTVNTVLEVFSNVSKALDAKSPEGVTIYWKNVLNNKSEYVWACDNPSVALYTSVFNAQWGTAVSTSNSFRKLEDLQTYTLSGAELTAYTENNTPDIESAKVLSFIQNFENPEESDVSLLIAGNLSASNAKMIVNIAEARQDCIAFVSAKCGDVVDASGDVDSEGSIYTVLSAYRNIIGSSSYGVMDSNAKYQYDRYNDKFFYLPLCADIAGCCVRTDTKKDPWWSPAGYERGRINNIVKLVWNPSKTFRDKLYQSGINPVISAQGTGAILFGDKTLQLKASAFDRINVRRLFNVLEKTISTAAKFQLFEFNDAFTRAQFSQLVEPFLREVQGKRGISSYAVVCNETNNPGSVVDQNQFVADIFVAPARSINFIRLNFVATPTGVTFAEFGG